MITLKHFNSSINFNACPLRRVCILQRFYFEIHDTESEISVFISVIRQYFQLLAIWQQNWYNSVRETKLTVTVIVEFLLDLLILPKDCGRLTDQNDISSLSYNYQCLWDRCDFQSLKANFRNWKSTKY